MTASTVKIRISHSLRSRIERSAKRNKLTINAEVVDRLDRSFEGASVIANRVAESIINQLTLRQRT